MAQQIKDTQHSQRTLLVVPTAIRYLINIHSQTLSPHCFCPNNISFSTPNINSFNNPPQLNDTKSPDERRTCSINSICTYIFKSSEERKKLLESARNLNRALSHIDANKLIIQLKTSPSRSQMTEVTTA